MPPHVYFEAAHLIETPITDVTSVGLFTGVLSEMYDQTALLIETPMADLATVRLFASVAAHVDV